MKKATLLIFLAFTIQLKAQVYKSSEGIVSFFSVAPIENIDATSNDIVSLINTSTNEIVFRVPISTFQFKKKKMQTDFNENFMESEKYPDAAYKGKINKKIDWAKNGTYKITSKGKLTIHGVENERTDTATVSIKNGKITMKGEFKVRVADHNIKIPKLLFEKIAEVVTVKFNMSYSPYKETSKNDESLKN